MIEKRNFYIDGKWVAPHSSRTMDVIDPSTEEVCALISIGDETDTNRAVAAAKAAYPAWSATTPAQRLAYVEKILEIYLRRETEMGELISLEMGAPIDMAIESQATSGSWHIENFIEAFKTFEFIRPAGPEGSKSRLAHQPVGVVALITPWNWPMNQVALKVIPAMLAGCTMILKPSEIAPLSSLLFAEIVHEAGVPAGVFNLVNGDGAGVGAQLSSHPDVEMVSFTGSTRAGTAITIAAAATMKKVALELGGKGANLIFADADANAVKRGARHCFNNSGQSCNAPTRMLVERPIYDKAVEIAKQVAEETSVASAHQKGKHIGPVAGGPGRPAGLNRGYFVRPTVFADVTPGMTIEKEEIFGPVLSILPFDTEEEALEIANDTQYGLTNYVQTQDPARRKRLALALRAGMIEVNGVSLDRGTFFGGVKSSGRAREGGHWGIEEFLDSKMISEWA
jgi:aldehyde dehydrogenase (NAD+)